jgi:glycosyltransferase involved in cell wall biosynthesis
VKRFSIITPTLNSGAKLQETIESVLSQGKDLFEYIIVDGSSSDETLEIIKRYDGQLKWTSETDRGVYDAMNKGIEMASGDYLYFLGAGDHLRNKVLERIENLAPNEDLIFLYGKVYYLDEKREYLGRFNEAKIARANICHQAIFYSRRIFEVVGKYDLRYKLLADHAFNIKCFGDQRIKKIYVDEVIADYEGQGVSKVKDLNFIKDMPRLIRENLGLKRYLLNRLKNAQDKVFHPDYNC